MSKSIALAAFNAAVTITNGAYAAKRGVVAAASFTKDNAVAGAAVSKEAGVAFWAGMKYAYKANKEQGTSAERLTAEDVAKVQSTEAAKSTELVEVAKPRATNKRTAKHSAA